MRTRIPSTRWWLAVAYTLAAVVVHGAHDHGGTEAAGAKHEAGCHDPRLHISGHPSPDLGHHPLDCFACQFRSNHYADDSAPPALYRPGVVLATETTSAEPRPGPSRPFSSRAPPRA